MATIQYQQAKAVGTTVTFAAATVGGDSIAPDDHGLVLVKNGDGTATTVTVVTPGVDKYGIARPDITFSVAASATAVLGPFPPDLGDQTTDKLVDLTYSKVTSLTVGAVRI